MSNGEAIVAWATAGKPEIPLGKGCDVSRLPTFLAYCLEAGLQAEIEAVKRYLEAGNE